MTKLVISALASVALAACATKPATVSEQSSLDAQARSTLGQMAARDSRINDVLHDAYGYAVFPDIGKAGAAGVGGAFGRGVLFIHGMPSGFVKLEQASAGVELGGETFAELLVLHTPAEVQKLKRGELDLGAGASAVVLKEGAAINSPTIRGADVFVMPRGGAMVEVSVRGQRIQYAPAG